MENKQELSIDNESHAFNQKRIKATIGNIQILWYIFGMKQAEIISMKMCCLHYILIRLPVTSILNISHILNNIQ
jgi:hypothetical protein